MASASKRKGSRIEREIVNKLLAEGIPAKRVPLSGALGGEHSGDVVVARRFRSEVKARRNGEGFATLKRWLGDNALLFLREDRNEPVVAMPWPVFVLLLRALIASESDN